MGFIKIHELSQNLDRSEKQLRKLADSGHIPSNRTRGGHRLFELEKVREALTRIDGAPTSAKPTQAALTSALNQPNWKQKLSIANLQEDLVWQELFQELNLNKETPAKEIMQFAFTEMLNNAVDHSGGNFVTISFWANELKWAFTIEDNGVGAFSKVRRHFNLANNMEAVIQLSKGKQTTAPKAHSGEGIFFTSKMVDIFILESNEIKWIVDNVRDDNGAGQSQLTTGTRVICQLATQTQKTSQSIFEQFTRHHDFVITNFRVHLLDYGTEFVSRSEAKRLMNGLDKFEEIILDFKGVYAVGQGFVDEIFRVWISNHPKIKITGINMNNPITFMVERGMPK